MSAIPVCPLMHVSYTPLTLTLTIRVIFQNYFTAPFNNTRTLKFKAQPTNAFLATVNQMFDDSSQLPTTAEHFFVACQ